MSARRTRSRLASVFDTLRARGWEPGAAAGWDADTVAENYGLYINWQRLAVNEDHFDRFNILPLAPKTRDARCKSFVKRFGERCAEVEAVPANDLRDMVRTAIESHIPQDEWTRLQRIENEERQQWHKLMLAMNNGGDRDA
jgi:hypothetical protein